MSPPALVSQRTKRQHQEQERSKVETPPVRRTSGDRSQGLAEDIPECGAKWRKGASPTRLRRHCKLSGKKVRGAVPWEPEERQGRGRLTFPASNSNEAKM